MRALSHMRCKNPRYSSITTERTWQKGDEEQWTLSTGNHDIKFRVYENRSLAYWMTPDVRIGEGVEGMMPSAVGANGWHIMWYFQQNTVASRRCSRGITTSQLFSTEYYGWSKV
jgi:hypothetical protein